MDVITRTIQGRYERCGMIGDMEICPKCHKHSVYAYHYPQGWKIFCNECKHQTKWHNTHKSARCEWDRLSDIYKHIGKENE